MQKPRPGRILRAVVAGLVVVAGSGCCSMLCRPAPPADPVAHVPSAAERLEIEVTAEWPGAGLDQAVAMSVCLLKGAEPSDCRDGKAEGTCNTLGAERIEAAVRPFLTRLAALELKNRFTAPVEIRSLGLGVTPTVAVTDARRLQSCRVWTSRSSGCLAVLVPVSDNLGLWVLLHPKATGTGGVERIDLFARGDPCGADLGRLR